MPRSAIGKLTDKVKEAVLPKASLTPRQAKRAKLTAKRRAKKAVNAS